MVVGEDRGEGVDILKFRGEAGADDVVGTSHALDDVAGDVGVDVVGFEVHGLARFELDEVQEEEDEEADVGWELGVASLDELAEFLSGVDGGTGRNLVLLSEGDEILRFRSDRWFVGLHEMGKGGFESRFGFGGGR